MRSNVRNKVVLVGNAGTTPDGRELTGGNKVTRFTMATSESYKNKDGEYKTDTTWHNIVAWGKLADYCEKNVQKGLMVAVEGKIQTRMYEDKDGGKRWITEIVISDLVPMRQKAAA
jgi:single-strand DNA-binding protein